MDERTASIADAKELITAAEEAGVRINLGKKGWPRESAWLPLLARRRFGTAIGASELMTEQVFLRVKRAGPWLGQDGNLYGVASRLSASFYVLKPREITLRYSRQQIQAIITRLNTMGR